MGSVSCARPGQAWLQAETVAPGLPTMSWWHTAQVNRCQVYETMTVPAHLQRTFGSCVLLTALLVGSGLVQAQTIDGCIDAQGRAVPAIADDLLPGVAQATIEDGHAVVRYSSAALPRLSPTTRMFFFAHECARIALGHPIVAPRTPGTARQADCWALVALQGSNFITGDAALRELQSELQFTDAEWRLLPGPKREFHLDACTVRGALRMPGGAAPSQVQLGADRCVHACGDRLWQCQSRCPDAGCRSRCESAFGRCEADCPDR